MNKLQKDNLIYRLTRRTTLIEDVQGRLADIGSLVRQIEMMDRKLLEAFADDGITFPACFTTAGLLGMFNDELTFQIEQGDPQPGTFLAMVAPERISMVDQLKEIHNQLIAGNFDTERN
jgi:hypothetical protein